MKTGKKYQSMPKKKEQPAAATGKNLPPRLVGFLLVTCDASRVAGRSPRSSVPTCGQPPLMAGLQATFRPSSKIVGDEFFFFFFSIQTLLFSGKSSSVHGL